MIGNKWEKGKWKFVCACLLVIKRSSVPSTQRIGIKLVGIYDETNKFSPQIEATEMNSARENGDLNPVTSAHHFFRLLPTLAKHRYALTSSLGLKTCKITEYVSRFRFLLPALISLQETIDFASSTAVRGQRCTY